MSDDGQPAEPAFTLQPYVTGETLIQLFEKNVPDLGLGVSRALRVPATRGDLIGLAIAQAQMWAVLTKTLATIAGGSKEDVDTSIDQLLEAARQHDQDVGKFLSDMFGAASAKGVDNG